MIIVRIFVPLLPPSVNSYVRHTRAGRHYVTAEAKAFKQAVAILARRKRVEAKAYRVTINVMLGKGDRGDLDNFAKVVLDSLVDAGVIHSDAAVSDLVMSKTRSDDGLAGTEITVGEA